MKDVTVAVVGVGMGPSDNTAATLVPQIFTDQALQDRWA
jgi:hypothetical protein